MSNSTEVKLTSESLAKLVLEGMHEKKAQEVVLIDLRKIKNAVADFFVICTGSSDIQIDAISDAIEEQIHENAKQNPWKKEGKENKEWIIIDYVDVVAHIFSKEKRMFYGLEELWGDAKITIVAD